MRNTFIAFVCALVVAIDASDSSGKLQNKGQPKVVSLYINGSRSCTGVMIFDLTILVVPECFMKYQDEKLDITIKFANNKKSYKAALKIHSENQRNAKIHQVNLAVLTLDEKENPPKSEWTFQLPESDKRDNKAQITLIRNFEDEDDVKTIDVKLDDCKNNKYTWYNLTKTICVKGGETWETNKEDLGAPLFLGGIFAGVMKQEEGSTNPSLFEYLYYDKDFFKKLPQNPAKNEKPANKKKIKSSH